MPEEALLTLIDLVSDSPANARALVAAEREGAALFQHYLHTCGVAGRQVHAVCVPACSWSHSVIGHVNLTGHPG